MSGHGEIFLRQVHEAQAMNMGVLTMPTFREPQMASNIANGLPWEEFRERIEPLATIRPDPQGPEYLLIEKSVGWGVEDINLFVGATDRDINEIDDLTSEEGRAFLRTNFSIAEHLLDTDHAQSAQVTIGFNPQDFSVGHHSVLRLHSHVRATPHDFDLARRKQYSWHELRRFDQMSFIEPFAPLCHDYIERAVQSGLFGSLVAGEPQLKTGFTTLELARVADLSVVFDDLKALYAGMKAEYDVVADIFTDKTIDPSSGKYLPRPSGERQTRLEAFLATRQGFYSMQSERVLRYLADHVRQAVSRDPADPFDMSSAAKVYASRGFAGAMTFGFERNEGTVRFEFFPRVITTSGAVKTLMSKDMPTIVDRIIEPVSREEAEITRGYHRRVASFLLEQSMTQP